MIPSKSKSTPPICVSTPTAHRVRAASTSIKPTPPCASPHEPTGIVVQCQNDRSQHANKAAAMENVESKLYELEMRKRNEEKQALEEGKSDVGWGSQIRSYVLDSSRIKDLRTGYEVGNTKAVLDGDLDGFIEASLKQGV